MNSWCNSVLFYTEDVSSARSCDKVLTQSGLALGPVLWAVKSSGGSGQLEWKLDILDVLDVVGLEHSGRHGELRDCVQPADLLSV